MTTLWTDTETFSAVDLSATGAYRYAPHAEILLNSYALDDGPGKLWDRTETRTPPAELVEAYHDPHVKKVAHNSPFDRLIVSRADGLKIDVPIEQWRCTMVASLSHAFPGSLDAVGKVLGLPTDKAKLASGKKLINRFCKPSPASHKVRRYTSETHPTEWQQFREYAVQDVEAMREVARRLPRWNWQANDIALWHLDQKINDRGMAIDRELVEAGARASITERARLDKEFTELCADAEHLIGQELERPSQRDRFRKYLGARFGLHLDNTRSDTFQPLIDDGDLDPVCERLLMLSLMANKTSTAKYAALSPMIDVDDRFRGGLQFRGAARTRRYAGRGFQPQNLPSRGLPPQPDIEQFQRALKADMHDVLFVDQMALASAAIRGVVIAPNGKRLAVADLANIEGRKGAWFAGEKWKLKAFRDYDAGTGPDLYMLTAGGIVGGDPLDIKRLVPGTAEKVRNVFGKVPDLACFAGHTMVVTDAGLVRMDQVTTQHKLWDGVEWVSHEGLALRGDRATVNLDGVEVTPDHLIRTGRTWKRAAQLVSNGEYRRRALATGSAALPCGASPPARRVGCSASPCPATAAGRSTKFRTRTCTGVNRPVAKGVGTAICHASSGATCVRSLATKSSGGSTTVRQRRFGGVTTLTTRRTLTTAVAASKCTRRGASTGTCSSPTSQRYPVRTTPRLKWTAPTSTGAMSRATYGSSTVRRTAKTSAPSENCKPVSRNLKPVYDIVNAGPRARFTIASDSGYLIVHNCLYMGGFGAFQQFAKTYGLRTRDGRAMANYADTIYENVDAKLVAAAKANWTSWGQERNADADPVEWLACEAVKLAWRARHPATVQLWKDIKSAVVNAIENPGRTFRAGPLLRYDVQEWSGIKYLRCHLPSGGFLVYCRPRVHYSRDGSRAEAITYEGIDATASGGLFGKWQRLHTHPGKFLEQACQSSSLDILMANIPGIEAAGFEVVLTVHDELICETDDAFGGDAAELSKLMSRVPKWAHGLPLAADGFDTYRYAKG